MKAVKAVIFLKPSLIKSLKTMDYRAVIFIKNIIIL